MPHLPHVHVVFRTVHRTLKSGEKRSHKYLYLRYRDHSGREFMRPARTQDRRKAERLAAEWERELRAGSNPTDATWDTICEKFEYEYLQMRRSATSERALQAIDGLTMYAKPKHASDITDAIITEWIAARMADGISRETIKTDLQHVRKLFRWSHDLGLVVKVPRFPRIKVDRTRGTLRRGRAISGDEFRKLLQAVSRYITEPEKHVRWRRFLRLLWVSGLRVAEASRLSWDASARLRVDLKKRRMIIHASEQKSGIDDTIPLVPELVAFLELTPTARRRGRVCRLPIRSAREISRTVASIGRTSKIVTDATHAGGPRYVTAHDLRRSFGSRWAPYLMPVDLQRLMRHKDVRTTMEYYVDVDADSLGKRLDAAAKIAASLEKKPTKGTTRGKQKTPARKKPRKRSP